MNRQRPPETNRARPAAPCSGPRKWLQLPSDSGHQIAPSAFASIQNLASGFALVDRETFVGVLAERGCTLVRQHTRPLPTGKAFWMGIFAGPLE